MAKLVFGCGYLGVRVARRWLAAGDETFVVTRSTQRAVEFREQGFRPLVADVVRRQTLVDLPAADTVLYAVGFDRTAGHGIEEVYVDGLAAVLDALPRATGRLIFVSSTGVYGSSGGAWVDEDTPCEPQRASGRACLEAERVLERHVLGPRAVVLRMAGLYGPGRIPRGHQIAAGTPLSVPSDGYLNLIHVDDAASVVLAAEKHARAPRRYVVSDGHPVVRRDYYQELARLLSAPPPTFDADAKDTPAHDRAAADKRVSNRRMCAELLVELEYPSFREGLAAIVAAERPSG